MHTMRIIAVIAAVSTLICITGARSTEYLPEQADLFKKALNQHGLDPADVRIDQHDLALWGGDKYRLPLLDNFLENPWKISSTSRSLTDGMVRNADNLPYLVESAHKRTGHGVRLSLIGDPLETHRASVEALGADSLAIALSDLTGESPESYLDSEDRITGYSDIPAELRDSVAVFLFALPQILKYRELGLVQPIHDLGHDPDEVFTTVIDYLTQDNEEDDIETVLLLEALMDNVDWDLLNTGASLAAIATQNIHTALTAEGVDLSTADFHFSAITPYGLLVLNGNEDDVYPAEHYLLTVDTLGAEGYESVAATRSIGHPLSVTVDLDGIDTYFDEDQLHPSFGAGLFGYALMIDGGGDDWYAMADLGLGCGVFGTGAVLNIGGDDAYQARSMVEGAGIFGSGVLSDTAGEDYYWLYQYGQGYGYTMGCGMLVDALGDDHFHTEILHDPNGGPFGEERFIHFAQGAGYGRRADYTDGHSWAGGVGILADGGGDDRYDCEVYGQGTGYWYAVGICADKGGDDYHNAGWYSLGGSPHMGVGVFQDDQGDDRYHLTHMQSLGNGRDFSVGWFEDSSGNDWYQGGIMTFGVGDINGIGVFWDKAGDDTYLAHGPCFGQSRIEHSGSIRDNMLTLGLFVDGGGTDTYLDLTGSDYIAERPYPPLERPYGLADFAFAGNGLAWTRATNQNEVPGAYGCAIDAE